MNQNKPLTNLEPKAEKSVDSQSELRLSTPTLTAQDIMGSEFPNLPWIIPGLLPSGLTVLASRPKLGKSWLCLGMGLGVATGGTVLGQIEVPKRDVLYISLEDTARRLQNRLKMVLQDAPAPEQFHFALHWPRLNGGAGTKAMDNWMKDHPETGLIIIDTLARIRGSRRGSFYDNDYEDIAQLKSIADDYSIGIIVVHHLRKTEAKDIFDMVSGSTGLTGAADNVALLLRDRSRADAILYLGGREVEDQELALKFESEHGSWVIMGPADEYQLTEERQQILDLLKQEGSVMRLADITTALGKKKPNVINLLNNLIDRGLVEKAGYGKYRLKLASGAVEAPSHESPEEVEEVSDGFSEDGDCSELSEPNELAA
jgi:hypothetical protein